MFTCIATLQGFVCFCFQCPADEQDIQSITTSSSQQPLLSRDSPDMPPRRTYGTKRSTTSAAASAIFGRSHPIAIPTSHRQPLSDLTNQFANSLTLRDNESEDENAYELEESIKSLPVSAQSSAGNDNAGQSPTNNTLLPLINAYSTDRDITLSIQSWDTVLSSEDCTLHKIAEASFAEVYRVTTTEGTSILKIMQLKVPEDPVSLKIPTACEVENISSELRIMDSLTEVPGFVTFKEVHLIRGKPCPQIKQAWDATLAVSAEPSLFPDPDAYTTESTFIVIELGDAGDVLEACPMTYIEQVWDVLLSVIMGLARAEVSHEFEHRDLHENNICLIQKRDIAHMNPDDHGTLKFGFSGIETTIIDYGLSRAKLSSGDIAFHDLEQDLSIFRGHDSGGHKIQFDNYRRTRNYLFTGDRRMHPREWHNEESRALNNGHTWSEHIPYSNVLWIRYILHYLEKSFKKHGIDQKSLYEFRRETTILKTRLNPQTLPKNGAFVTAQEVLVFVADQGWVNKEQLEAYGVDSTFLSEASRVEG